MRVHSRCSHRMLPPPSWIQEGSAAAKPMVLRSNRQLSVDAVAASVSSSIPLRLTLSSQLAGNFAPLRLVRIRLGRVEVPTDPF
jgi:hypothetical protein